VEGLIILLVLYFVFQSIVKRFKAYGGKASPADANTKPIMRTQTVHEPQSKIRRAVSDSTAQKQTVLTPLRPNEPYQSIRPTVMPGDGQRGNSGSLGGDSTEGRTLLTSNLTSEGKSSLEGITTDEGGEVFSDSVLHGGMLAYELGNNADTAIVLPEEWNRDTLIQGIVMREILDRPKRRGYIHG
jgi:hypothetical protein